MTTTVQLEHPEDLALDDADLPEHISIPLDVGLAGCGYRLDRYLGHRFERLSRARIHEMIAAGRVMCRRSNKRLTKKSMRVSQGMQLWVHRPAPKDEPVLPLFKVLHNDGDLLVIDKAPGVPVQPTARQVRSALPSQLDQVFGSGHGWEIAHRLDRETSGLMLLGRAGQSATTLKMAFERREIQKSYVALAHGHLFQPRWVNAPVGPDLQGSIRIKMAAGADTGMGQEALTHFQPVALSTFRDRPASWILARPHTGRTHQIRVHAMHVGCPLVGDKLYGIPEEKFLEVAQGQRDEAQLGLELGMPHQALHAFCIALRHPVTKRPFEISCPLPSRMSQLVDAPSQADLMRAWEQCKARPIPASLRS